MTANPTHAVTASTLTYVPALDLCVKTGQTLELALSDDQAKQLEAVVSLTVEPLEKAKAPTKGSKGKTSSKSSKTKPVEKDEPVEVPGPVEG